MKLFRKHKPVLIFSVFTHAGRALDLDATNKVAQGLKLDGVPFKIVEGRFDGAYEQSFVVSADYLEQVLEVADEYSQEYILHLDEYRKARLIEVYSGTVQTVLGQWQVTDSVYNGEDYAYDPATKQHFVVR